MKNNYVISINQLAAFSKATEAGKKRIIRQQKEPNKFLVAWYQFPKARIRKAIANNCDLEPVLKGIEELKLRKPEKPRQVLDREVSLEAMRRFINIKLPKLLKDVPHEIVKKVNTKSVIVNGVEIIVSPDVIYKLNIDGNTFIGAVKVHISKSNIFDNKQSRYISSLVYKYLKEVVIKENEEVLEELCLSIDVYSVKKLSKFQKTYLKQ
ncbi:hypothetical protein L3X39_01805 [Sabulilitoribacter multivorans]|uniref:Uncharacterized protein n=1 Tax=Flaviramulus multivorans TaxID=1304750 RepID=A0ABS9IFP2_9FLAO|nr:hypothetical protein [Flaviramulus multivorans]MCF7559356.1 hypothetical protein [Flaviramulus multivorans]